MPSLSTTVILLFLLTLPIPPLPSLARGHFTPSAFGFPTALAFIPRHVFTTTPTPRSWEVARCVQYLVWAWAGVGFLQAVGRTVMRLKRGSLKLEEPNEGNSTSTSAPGTASKHTTRTAVVLVGTRSYTPKPLLAALTLHLISWRLATTLVLPDLPGAWKWPFDLTTLIGLGTGLVCSWGEVGRVLMILGITGSETEVSTNGQPRPRPRAIKRVLHAGLALHRLVLAVWVLSATLESQGKGDGYRGEGGSQPIPGIVPA